MKPKTKFMIGGAVVLGTSVWLMISSIKQTGEYYLTPTEMSARIKASPSFKGADVRVAAHVIPGSIKRDPGGREYTFLITDSTGIDTLQVNYKGLAPDTFTDGVDVVVTGRATEGTFHAVSLLAKCASRYEAAPTGPNTPGARPAGKKA